MEWMWARSWTFSWLVSFGKIEGGTSGGLENDPSIGTGEGSFTECISGRACAVGACLTACMCVERTASSYWGGFVNFSWQCDDGNADL